MVVASIAVLALSAVVSLPGRPAQGSPAFDTLVRVVEAHLATHKVPGAAVVVVRGDSVVFARGFGVANVATQEPATPDMLFRAGSSSKMFTAALVTLLAAERRLDLRAPADRYVTGLDPAIARLTLDRLLSHSAGLKDEAAEQGSDDEGALVTYARSWTSAYAMLPPGTVFSYSNGGYALAGLIAQQAMRTSFAELATEWLFGPLGMTRTTYRHSAARAYPMALGYAPPPGQAPNSDSLAPQPYSDDTRFWPAGYAYTSAREFARFLIAIMNDGRVDGRQVLPPSVARSLLTPRVRVPNIFADAHYGYGLFIGPYRGATSAWHDGQMPGFGSLVRIIPRRREGVVVLLNRSNVRMDAIVDAAFDALGVKGPASPPNRAPPLMPMTHSEARQYVGQYVNRWPVELTVRDGALYRSWFGQQARVYKIGAQRFTVDSARASRSAEFTMVRASAKRPGYVHVALWAFVRAAPDSSATR